MPSNLFWTNVFVTLIFFFLRVGASNIKSSSNVYIFKLNKKDSFEQNKFDAEYDSLNIALLQIERNQIYNNWLNSEKENINIKDMRSEIF